MSKPPVSARPEPRWPALAGLMATGLVFLALPERLTPGPNWVLLLITGLLGVPTVITHRQGYPTLNRVFGMAEAATITLFLAWALVSLLAGLPSHRESGPALLAGAGGIWIANILVFAAWYWRLDAGGPHRREQRPHHHDGAFLFPQMNLGEPHSRAWRPGFVDYLFLAFNTSTAFSPTDVSPLTRWAKLLMMAQSLLSLTTLAVIAARAVNVL